MNGSDGARRPDTPARALLALILLVPAPSIGSALALLVPATEGTALGKVAYVLAKVWIFVLPALWWILVERGRPSLSPARRGGFALASLLGVAITAAIVGAYVLMGPAWIDPATVRSQAANTGLDRPLMFLAAAVYFCTINAVLEEYVWRWFVFRKCETALGGRGLAAVFLSAILFTLHHVLVLAAQFDWKVTAIGSLGVCAGGAIWSWCYLRYRSIWPGYVSHAIVDVAIFVIGWRIIFG